MTSQPSGLQPESVPRPRRPGRAGAGRVAGSSHARTPFRGRRHRRPGPRAAGRVVDLDPLAVFPCAPPTRPTRRCRSVMPRPPSSPTRPPAASIWRGCPTSAWWPARAPRRRPITGAAGMTGSVDGRDVPLDLSSARPVALQVRGISWLPVIRAHCNAADAFGCDAAARPGPSNSHSKDGSAWGRCSGSGSGGWISSGSDFSPHPPGPRSGRSPTAAWPVDGSPPEPPARHVSAPPLQGRAARASEPAPSASLAMDREASPASGDAEASRAAARVRTALTGGPVPRDACGSGGIRMPSPPAGAVHHAAFMGDAELPSLTSLVRAGSTHPVDARGALPHGREGRRRRDPRRRQRTGRRLPRPRRPP